MQFVQMQEDYFSIRNKIEIPKLPSSSIDFKHPIDSKSFVEKKGSSGFLRMYAGNTFRSVTANQEQELSLSDGMSTISWDFYKNNGDFFAQMVLFLSIDAHLPKSQRQKILAITDLLIPLFEKQLPIYYQHAMKNSDTASKQALENLLQKFFKKKFPTLTKNFNVTCVITFYTPELMTKGLQILPEDCSIFIKDELTSDFIPVASKCYVITKDKLFYINKEILDGTQKLITKEIESTRIALLRETLADSKINEQGLISAKSTHQDGSERDNLRFLINFLRSENKLDTLTLETTCTTLILNSGRHLVSLSNPTAESLVFHDSKSSSEVSSTIGHYRQGVIIQVQSHSDLFHPEDKGYNFNNITEKLVVRAESLRQQAEATWEQPSAKVWLLLVSRLFAFQNRLNKSQLYPLPDPPDPTYAVLSSASLINFKALEKALQNTQRSADDNVDLEEKDVKEIKHQWQTAQTTKLMTWQQAFLNQNPHAALRSGGPVRVVCIEPLSHALNLHNFLINPIDSSVAALLNNRKIEFNIASEDMSMITTFLPSKLKKLTLDTVREFVYQDIERRPSTITNKAKLTVIYSPRYLEKLGWERECLETRELILTTLSQHLFTNIKLFWRYKPNLLPKIRQSLTDLLTKEPFSNAKASLLFCLTVSSSDHPTYRFLVGVGNCLALSFIKNEEPIVEIKPMSDAKGAPVLLKSLTQPDNYQADIITTLVKPSHIRQQECLQIVVIDNPEKEILLISGRQLSNQMSKPITFESKLGLRAYGPDLKALKVEIEDDKTKTIDKVMNAIKQDRRKFLDIIENKDMITAWQKLENLYTVKDDKILKVDTPSTTELSFSDVFQKVGAIFQKHKPVEIISGVINEKDSAIIAQIQKVKNSMLESFFKEFNILTEIESSPVAKFTEVEAEKVTMLWQTAIAESPSVLKSTLTWENVRGRYFLYFKGVSDAMAVIAATTTIEKPHLIEYIHGLSQSPYSLKLDTEKKAEAQEIQTFTYLLCARMCDEIMLSIIYDKLELICLRYSYNEESITKEIPLFWQKLAELILFLFLPTHFNSYNPIPAVLEDKTALILALNPYSILNKPPTQSSQLPSIPMENKYASLS